MEPPLRLPLEGITVVAVEQAVAAPPRPWTTTKRARRDSSH
ncbi:hypothetical protein [Streptomyces sp. NPDC002088]